MGSSADKFVPGIVREKDSAGSVLIERRHLDNVFPGGKYNSGHSIEPQMDEITPIVLPSSVYENLECSQTSPKSANQPSVKTSEIPTNQDVTPSAVSRRISARSTKGVPPKKLIAVGKC